MWNKHYLSRLSTYKNKNSSSWASTLSQLQLAKKNRLWVYIIVMGIYYNRFWDLLGIHWQCIVLYATPGGVNHSLGSVVFCLFRNRPNWRLPTFLQRAVMSTQTARHNMIQCPSLSTMECRLNQSVNPSEHPSASKQTRYPNQKPYPHLCHVLQSRRSAGGM